MSENSWQKKKNKKNNNIKSFMNYMECSEPPPALLSILYILREIYWSNKHFFPHLVFDDGDENMLLYTLVQNF